VERLDQILKLSLCSIIKSSHQWLLFIIEIIPEK